MAFRHLTAAAVAVVLTSALAFAQQPDAPTTAAPDPPDGTTASGVVEPSGEVATLKYFNRPIVDLRARILGRTPRDRAALAVRILDGLVASSHTRPVAATPIAGGVVIGVGDRVVVGLANEDLDELSGETLEEATQRTITRMQLALDEVAEARRPGMLLRAAVTSLAALVVGALVLWVLGRLRRVGAARLAKLTQRAVQRTGLADQNAQRVSHLLEVFQRRLVMALIVASQLSAAYVILTFVLRQFPFTRPWGESLGGVLAGTLRGIFDGAIGTFPGLLTVVVIVVITRVVILLCDPWFDAVERGAITVSWMHAETANTTRRLVTIALWMFAATVAYPYVPGSDTEAFKGISVFVGLILTLGSSGLVNQMMSGVMITYSRALRMGDFVRVGDVEGTVIHLGVLSTKIRTLRSEEITVPNAVVVSQTIVDYSRFHDVVRTTTSATIGYDVPWRQVHAMLLIAAERTPGIRRDPPPFVMQAALEEKAVKYTLSFCLEVQQQKLPVLSALHAHIQDEFNEHGVQIMAPGYEGDPEAPKIVPKERWFAAPARPEPPASGTGA